jgi:hypothetical protein
VSNKDIGKIRALVQDAEPPEGTVQLCLRLSVQRQIEALEQQLIEMRRGDEKLRSLGDNPDSSPIRDQIEALIAEAKDATIDVLLRAMPHKQWRDLVAKHPAKTDDYLYDANGLMDEAVPMCWVEPELDKETIDKLLEKLTQGQWDALVEKVTELNRGEGRVPFSALASQLRQNSDATSKKPADSA